MTALLNEGPLSHALSDHDSKHVDGILSGVVHPYAAKSAKPIGHLPETNAASQNAPAGVDEHIRASPQGTYPSAAARQALFYTAQEQIQEVAADVQGRIPEWLSGSLVMNGGGDYSHMRHLFDGYGLLSKVRLEGGKAWGSQRYIATQAYRLYKDRGYVVMNEFATPPATILAYLHQGLALFGYLFTKSISPMTDNACVSVYSIGPAAAAATVQQRSTDKQRTTTNTNNISSAAASSSQDTSSDSSEGVQLFAITEDPWGSYYVDPVTLQTIKQVQYPDRCPAIMQSPHPAVLSDGSLVNFSRTFPLGGSHVYRQDRTTLKRQEIAFVPDRHWLAPAWMHDFAATDRYAVLIEQPLYLDFLAMVAGWDNNAAWMKWRPEEGTRVHLVTLDGSKPVRTFTAPTFCYVHTGNAVESADGSTLHVDLAVFSSADILNDLKLQALRHGPDEGRQVTPSQYMRLDVPLDIGGTLHIQGPQPLIKDAAAKHVDFVDFPSIHPALKGRPYRFVYSTCAVRPTHIGNGLSKLDLHTGEVKVWHEAGGVAGEPHFIAAPGAGTAADIAADAAREDDGVVLSQCVDAQGRAFLLVLDAKHWTELGRAVLPYSTPYRFHGVWLPMAAAS